MKRTLLLWPDRGWRRVAWLAMWLGVAGIALEARGTNFVVRTLPRMYTPGVPITVTVFLQYEAPGNSAYASERPPAGWTITSFTTNGFNYIANTPGEGLSAYLVSPAGGGLASNVLSYTVVPPASEAGARFFSGQGQLDGGSQQIAGDRRIACDGNGDGIADAPPLSLRVSNPDAGVNLCWACETNRYYQVQYTDSLNSMLWTNLGPNTAGIGGTNCVSDAPPAGRPQRFYRLVELPWTREPIFRHALAAAEGISLNGNNSGVDSFDSGDPYWSTNGLYNPDRKRANGSLTANSGNIDVGNAKVMGLLLKSQEGGVTLGPNGGIGDMNWLANNTGIQPGWSQTGTPVAMPEVSVPFTNGAPPLPGLVGGVLYNAILSSGNYTLSNAVGKVLAVGGASLYVPSAFNMSRLVIAPGASLKLYVGAPSAIIGYDGVVNQTGYATNFQYYGLPGNTNVSLVTNSLIGVIYAPGAHFVFNSAIGSNHLSGAVVARTVSVSGAAQIHFDERLPLLGPWHEPVFR